MFASVQVSVEAQFMAAERFGYELNLACVFAEVAQHVVNAFKVRSLVALHRGAQNQVVRSLNGQHRVSLIDGGSQQQAQLLD